MRKIILTVILAFLALSCSKEVLCPVVKDGGVRYVSAQAGSFPVLVTSDCVWSVSSDDSWLTVNGENRSGKGSFIVKYASNESVPGDRRFNREGKLFVKTYDGALVSEIKVRQYGMVEPFMEIPDAVIGSTAGKQSVPFHTNLTDRERAYVACTSSSASILDPHWDEDGVHISFTATQGNEDVTLTVTFTDAWGQSYSVSGKISREDQP